MKTCTHVVTRPFDTGGISYTNGDLVDAGEWRNTEKMAKTGYLRIASKRESELPVTKKTKPAPVVDAPKRLTLKLRKN